MKIMATLKKIWIGACLYYTVLSLLVLLIALAISGGFEQMVISSLSFLLLFPFSLSLAAAQVMRKGSSLAAWAKGLLGYLLVLAAFLLFVWLPSNPSTAPMSWILAIVFFTLIYWAIVGIVSLTKKRFHSFREE